MQSEVDEKRLRIHLSVCSLAYEKYNISLISDYEYDYKMKLVNLDTATDRPDLDKWFQEFFTPDTGMWVRCHPEYDKLDNLVVYLLKLREKYN